MKSPVLIELPVPLAPPPAQALAAGLLATPAAIAPKYFYDALGSRLFEAITELDEYYPTRTEAAILERHGSVIFGGLRAGIPLVELGAGSCRKVERVLQWTQPSSFVAVEIAASFAREGLERLQERFPDLDLMAVGTDFSQSLLLPPALTAGPLNLFYPGSSIGNFDPAGALALLRSAAQACAGGALVIGVDTVKDGAVLDAAYDDALGVTAAFNLNVLRHVNRLLGSDFDPGDWQHRAFYAAGRRRIEMHLEARHALSVRWPGGSRAFAA
ncbi:MAG: L-histidine N(alpha)-methyltransferase, partial [Pseudomonadota bacterium]|nr:L-histidine N(alpha)-methyltransferase [Pseudomonadota bacterium]